MSTPVFLHVTSDGSLWISNNLGYTPPGTIVGTFRILDDAKSQKIGTLSGTCGSNLTQTGANGKQGSDIA